MPLLPDFHGGRTRYVSHAHTLAAADVPREGMLYSDCVAIKWSDYGSCAEGIAG